MDRQSTRRQALSIAGLGGPALLAGLAMGRGAERAAAQGATPEADAEGPVARVRPPDWLFVVHRFEPDYDGEMRQPENPPPGTRYVAAEVELDNRSDQPLNYFTATLRLRDEDGFEYQPGSAFGQEPALSSRLVEPGESARGWVWFTVPEESRQTELVFIASAPEFRAELPAPTARRGGSTPAS